MPKLTLLYWGKLVLLYFFVGWSFTTSLKQKVVLGCRHCDIIGFFSQPEVKHCPEKKSSYLSPKNSFQAAWARQIAIGRPKLLGKDNWEWDMMRSLSKVSAFLLAAVFLRLTTIILLLICAESLKFFQWKHFSFSEVVNDHPTYHIQLGRQP